MTRQSKHTRIGLIAVIAVLALTTVGSGSAAAADLGFSGGERMVDVGDGDRIDLYRYQTAYVGSMQTNASIGVATQPSESHMLVNISLVDSDGQVIPQPEGAVGNANYQLNPSNIGDGDPGASEKYQVLLDQSPIANITVGVLKSRVKQTNISADTIANVSGDSNISVTVDRTDMDKYGMLSSVVNETGSLEIQWFSGSDMRTRTSYVEYQTSLVSRDEFNRSFSPNFALEEASNTAGAENVNEVPTRIPDAVTEIKIDGQTVYQEDDGLLGGGGGSDGLDNQTFIGIAAAVLAILLVARD